MIIYNVHVPQYSITKNESNIVTFEVEMIFFFVDQHFPHVSFSIATKVV